MAITISFPSGSRATRIELSILPAQVASTHWEITNGLLVSFTIRTTSGGTTSSNVLDSALDFIEIWLPPSHAYHVRTRHTLLVDNGSLTSWTAAVNFTSRGPLNSYEKYLVLSGISGTDNIII